MVQAAVAVGFVAVVALDVEFLAEHVELALDGAKVALDPGLAELLVQLACGHLASARDAAQEFQGQARGFQGVGSSGHVGHTSIGLPEKMRPGRIGAQELKFA